MIIKFCLSAAVIKATEGTPETILYATNCYVILLFIWEFPRKMYRLSAVCNEQIKQKQLK